MTSTGVWDIIHGMQRARAMFSWVWQLLRDQDGIDHTGTWHATNESYGFMVFMKAGDPMIRRVRILRPAVKKEGNDQHGGKEKHFNLCRAKAI